MVADHVPLPVELQPGGLPVKFTSKVPVAAFPELNVPEKAVDDPVSENEFPLIVLPPENVILSPEGEGEQLPDKV